MTFGPLRSGGIGRRRRDDVSYRRPAVLSPYRYVIRTDKGADRVRPRRLGAIFAAALLAGACGGGAPDTATAADTPDDATQLADTSDAALEKLCGKPLDDMMEWSSVFIDLNLTSVQAGDPAILDGMFDKMSDVLIDFHGALEVAGRSADARAVRDLVAQTEGLERSRTVDSTHRWIDGLGDVLDNVVSACSTQRSAESDDRRDEFLDGDGG